MRTYESVTNGMIAGLVASGARACDREAVARQRAERRAKQEREMGAGDQENYGAAPDSDSHYLSYE